MSSSPGNPHAEQTSADIVRDLEAAMAFMAPPVRAAVMVLGQRAIRYDMIRHVVDGAPIPLDGPRGALGDGPTRAPRSSSSGQSSTPPRRRRPTLASRNSRSRGNVAYRPDVVELLLSVIEAPPIKTDTTATDRRAGVVSELKKLGLNTAILSQTGGANFFRWVQHLFRHTTDEVTRQGYMMRIQAAKGWTNQQLGSVIDTGKLPSLAAPAATEAPPPATSDEPSSHEFDLMRLELLEARRQGGAKAYKAKYAEIEAHLNARLGTLTKTERHITRVVSQLGKSKIEYVYARLLVHARQTSLSEFEAMLGRLRAATKKSEKTLVKIAQSHKDWNKVAGASGTAEAPAAAPVPAAAT